MKTANQNNARGTVLTTDMVKYLTQLDNEEPTRQAEDTMTRQSRLERLRVDLHSLKHGDHRHDERHTRRLRVLKGGPEESLKTRRMSGGGQKSLWRRPAGSGTASMSTNPSDFLYLSITEDSSS